MVNAPNAGRRARPTPPATSTRPSGARPSSSSARPGSATARAAAGASAFGAAPQPRAPPSRSNSTGIGTSRHESAATFHNDLFAGEPAAGATSAGGNAAAAAAKAAKARQLAAQKRRERQMHSGTIVQNDAMGVATSQGAAAAGPGRPVAPGGFARPRPPEAPTARQVSVGARQAASSSSRAFADPSTGAGFGGDSFSERRENGYAGSYSRSPQRVSYGGFPREYAEPRGAPVGGFMTGSPLASRADAGDFDRVHAFDGDIETLELDAEMTGESADARAMRREMASHGLSGEYDPNGGRHPRDVAADRERARELAEAEKMGEKARRVAARPKPARVDVTDRRAFLTKPGPRGGPVQCHIVRRKVKSMGFGKGYPEYFLYLDGPDTAAGAPNDDATFLLSARKRKKSKSSNYVISLDEDDLSRQSGNFFGKLRSNFVGTEFVIFDKARDPTESETRRDVTRRAPAPKPARRNFQTDAPLFLYILSLRRAQNRGKNTSVRGRWCPSARTSGRCCTTTTSSDRADRGR